MFNKKNVLFLFLSVFLLSLFSQPLPFTFQHFSEGDVTTSTIHSPSDYEFVDEEATEERRADILSDIQSFQQDDSIVRDLQEDIKSLTNTLSHSISSIDDSISYKEDLEDEKSSSDSDEEFEIDEKFYSEFESDSVDDHKDNISKKLMDRFGFNTEEAESLLSLNEGEVNKIYEIFTTEIELIYEERLESSDIDDAVRSLSNNPSYYHTFNRDTVNAIISFLSERMEPNFYLDVGETERNREEMEESIEDVVVQIYRGESLFSSGHELSSEDIALLEEVGVINPSFSWDTFWEITPFVFMTLVIFHFFIFHFQRDVFENIREYAFILLSISIAYGIARVFENPAYDDVWFVDPLIPIITLLMIFVVFWQHSIVLVSSILLSLITFTGDYLMFALLTLTTLVMMVTFIQKGRWTNIIISGLLIGLGMFIVNSIFSLSFTPDYHLQENIMLIFFAFLSSILTIGLLPGLERSLGLVSYVRLYELTDPNHPLIKKMLTEALNTHTHSFQVANLSELAADRIQVDSLLLRVSAYFHDVGKTDHPEYFIENIDDFSNNPHNDMTPKESAQVLINHVTRSIELCEKHKIPKPVIDVIRTHHGDDTLNHFFDKALEEDGNADIRDFKYSTPVPVTKEQGILYIADKVEAFSRSLTNVSSKKEFEDKLIQYINHIIQDGGLRESELTMKELDEIIKVFVSYLSNAAHSRPRIKTQKNQENND